MVFILDIQALGHEISTIQKSFQLDIKNGSKYWTLTESFQFGSVKYLMTCFHPLLASIKVRGPVESPLT